MPDWVHPVIYIFIWTGSIVLFINILENDWIGIIVGLAVGRLIATLIVSRLPGFWGDNS